MPSLMVKSIAFKPDRDYERVNSQVNWQSASLYAVRLERKA
jgi:hypothetical protein